MKSKNPIDTLDAIKALDKATKEQLQDHTGFAPDTISNHLEFLKERGWVNYTTHRSKKLDRLYYLYQLTPEGEEHLKEYLHKNSLF